ncbi:MAG: S8/S53 family peptidase [Candidatus Dormibacteraeota bacterium]|nr:S8/S53 family peptidase [Candidatus Dormibacteraeota bacterium]
MCDVNPDYTMLVGPQAELDEMRHRWDEVLGDLGYLDIPRPNLHSLREAGFGHAFDDQGCPAVAVIWLEGRLGSRLADLLQARVLVAATSSTDGLGANVMCEPGCRLQPASSSSGPGNALAFDAARVRQAGAAIGHGPGASVAVVDTGGPVTGSSQMVDFVGGTPIEKSPEDGHGHGTAVGGLIRALRPDAAVTPIRVANDRGLAESMDLVLGLTYALWPGTFDVVNVSLTSQLGQRDRARAHAVIRSRALPEQGKRWSNTHRRRSGKSN